MKSRRFYKTVSVTGGPWHRARWPPGEDSRQGAAPPADFRPSREAVAAEWEAQGETIDPASMILTRSPTPRLTACRPTGAPIAAEMLDFADSDLVCYRADRPAGSGGRASRPHGTRSSTGRGRGTRPADRDAGPVSSIARSRRRRWRRSAAGARNCLISRLAAFHSLMTLTGSALIRHDADQARDRARPGLGRRPCRRGLPDRAWGQDDEAAARRRRRHAEFMPAAASSCWPPATDWPFGRFDAVSAAA